MSAAIRAAGHTTSEETEEVMDIRLYENGSSRGFAVLRDFSEPGDEIQGRVVERSERHVTGASEPVVVLQVDPEFARFDGEDVTGHVDVPLRFKDLAQFVEMDPHPGDRVSIGAVARTGQKLRFRFALERARQQDGASVEVEVI